MKFINNRHLPGLKKTKKLSARIADIPAEIQTDRLTEYKSEAAPSCSVCAVLVSSSSLLQYYYSLNVQLLFNLQVLKHF
jgi:hypothetical protein